MVCRDADESADIPIPAGVPGIVSVPAVVFAGVSVPVPFSVPAPECFSTARSFLPVSGRPGVSG